MTEFIPGPPDSPDNFAGKKSLPSVSSLTRSSNMPFGLTWVHLLIGLVILWVVWKYVLKK